MAEENENEHDESTEDAEESEDRSDSDESSDSADEGSSSDGPRSESGDDYAAGESDEDLERRAGREAEAELRQQEREAEGMEDDTMAVLLGPERWVQFAFIAAGVAMFFLTDRFTTLIWSRFDEPDPAIVSAIAGATAIFGTFALYRHPAVNKLADEVVGELSKVTWPTRDEVWLSTIVVIATSVVAALYTGAFDAMWSALTNIVYG
jgi:preprotein translocase subunit SecE